MATGNWCKGIANSLEKSIIKGLNPPSPLFKPILCSLQTTYLCCRVPFRATNDTLYNLNKAHCYYSPFL